MLTIHQWCLGIRPQDLCGIFRPIRGDFLKNLAFLGYATGICVNVQQQQKMLKTNTNSNYRVCHLIQQAEVGL